MRVVFKGGFPCGFELKNWFFPPTPNEKPGIARATCMGAYLGAR